MNICITLCRDSSNDGQGDTVSLSMSVSELDDSGEGKGKKKRGRPGKQGVRPLLLSRSTDCIYLNHKCMLSATLPDLSLSLSLFARRPVRRPESLRLIKVGGGRMVWPIRMERAQTPVLCLRWSNKAKVPCR